MKKFNVLNIAAMSMLLGLATMNPISAQELKTPTGPVSVVVGDEVYEFENQASYDRYLAVQGKATKARYTNTVRVPLAEYDTGTMFLGYNSLTPIWSYASGYTLSANKTYSGGFSYNYEGYTLTGNVSYSTGASISFNANDSMKSRMGFEGKLKVSKARYDVYDNGTFVSSYVARAAVAIQSTITNKVIY